jgi:hypothetical protein
MPYDFLSTFFLRFFPYAAAAMESLDPIDVLVGDEIVFQTHSAPNKTE